VLSFDWVRIDDMQLDVFSLGVYPLAFQGVVPISMENTTSFEDACSQFTLSGFGDDLTLANRIS